MTCPRSAGLARNTTAQNTTMALVVEAHRTALLACRPGRARVDLSKRQKVVGAVEHLTPDWKDRRGDRCGTSCQLEPRVRKAWALFLVLESSAPVGVARSAGARLALLQECRP